MAEVVLFHHVQGLTDGVRAFAEELSSGGHTVHTPDLFDGTRLATIDEGLAHTGASGTRCSASAPTGQWPTCPRAWCMPVSPTVPARRSGSPRPGPARGALLYESCMPITGEWAFGPWPDGVPVQIHGMDKDPFFALGGDIDAARELVETVGSELAELFVYPGDRHLFTDSSLPSYDADAAALAVQRSRAFLDRVG